MPRVGPNYTLPQPPFQPQTPIASAAMNSDLSDIADALTGSLARNGAGGMTAVLPLANDGFVFQNDPDTGISRSAANTMSFECGNAEVANVSPAGMAVTGALSATGPVSQNGFPLLPVGLGPLPWSGLTAPGGWVLAHGQTLSRAIYAALWAFAQVEIAAGNTLYTNGDGSTTFTIPDMRGRVPAGKDNMGGTPANLLTSATITPNGDTLGGKGGGQVHQLQTTEIPSHTHANSLNDPGHGHAIQTGNTPGANYSIPPNATLPGITTGGVVSNNTTGVSINNAAAGGGGSHNNVQPTIIANYIIYAGA